MVKNTLIFLLASALLGLLLTRQTLPPPQAPSPAPAAPSPSPQHPILAHIQRATQEPALAPAAIGFCLLDEHGQVMLEHAAHTALIPASSLKTLTTATALQVWGPEHCIETQLLSAPPDATGHIPGDLIIRGGGDPTLSLHDLASWAAQLKARGIRHISGSILGDGRLFHGSIYGDYWGWGDIGNGYGSPVSGLNLEHNRYRVTLRPGPAIGSPAQLLLTQPEVPGVRWQNETLTAAKGTGDGVVIHTGEQSSLIFLRGTVPLEPEPLHVIGAVPDPPLYAAHHLRSALLAAGIHVAGTAAALREPTAQPSAPLPLLTHRSPPLRQIIASIHSLSDNHETDCLFRLLGLHHHTTPQQAIREHWQARGLTFQGLRMEDGSGLSRADFITPHDLARLQHLAITGPQGQDYLDSLLSQDGLHWKGGAMSGIRSITGHIATRSGRRLTFALIINHFTDPRAAQSLRESLLQLLTDL
jgi:D-alanyl-D-alanine carboxypeptidase/D-alanyl-D-alanine-endopeptidase (penicillin-binding protein 4)